MAVAPLVVMLAGTGGIAWFWRARARRRARVREDAERLRREITRRIGGGAGVHAYVAPGDESAPACGIGVNVSERTLVLGVGDAIESYGFPEVVTWEAGVLGSAPGPAGPRGIHLNVRELAERRWFVRVEDEDELQQWRIILSGCLGAATRG